MDNLEYIEEPEVETPDLILSADKVDNSLWKDCFLF